MDVYHLMDGGVLAILAKVENPQDPRGKRHRMIMHAALAPTYQTLLDLRQNWMRLSGAGGSRVET